MVYTGATPYDECIVAGRQLSGEFYRGLDFVFAVIHCVVQLPEASAVGCYAFILDRR